MGQYVHPDFTRCAVITIDTQNDFSLPGAVAEIKGTYEVLPQMKKLLYLCRTMGIPIIHVIRLYKDDGSNADICRRALIEAGTAIVRPDSFGADLVEDIKPLKTIRFNHHSLLEGNIESIGHQEWIMYKPRWGAFYQTPLEEFLQEHDLDTLIFIGCNFPNCPRTSMYEASERDFKIAMVQDAMSGVYPKGLEEIRNIGAAVYTTDEIIQELKGVRRPLM
ncbi:cysteine hydrolase family protein [Paenibacillus sp. 1001270B_150601_E10]|uniref:cysteine hydrolase family protein n=1 Tax=Paenibacillus sp. 1001270B_150601_E10 TaxID=2787079 RepID=UPI00189D8D4C|nr:cysteine hydrolase [Paenibacillus sp. 1001270B_150601_E10]